MQFYRSERIRTPLFLGSSARQNFDPTFVATLQGSSLSAGRFQKGKIKKVLGYQVQFLRSSVELRVFELLWET